MKTLIFSDIHSNIYALEAIWAEEGDSDLILCSGDLVDYGLYPKETLNWLREHDVCCVQGNHDRWVAALFRSEETLESLPAQERTWAHHNASLLDEQDIAYLEGLPEHIRFELDGITYGMRHLYKEYEEIVSLHAYQQFLRLYFDGAGETAITRLIFGHTHRQGVRLLSDHLSWLNPGSAAYRRKDDPDLTAHYAVITDGVVSLKRLVYDQAPLRLAINSLALSKAEMDSLRW